MPGVSISGASKVWGVGAQNWPNSQPLNSQPGKGLRIVWSVLSVMILAVVLYVELYKRAEILS